MADGILTRDEEECLRAFRDRLALENSAADQGALAEENISRVLEVANDPGRYDEAREHRLTRQDLQEVREIPERFVLAVGGAPRTRDFLSEFINEIQVNAGKAVVHYSIPLPEDSPLAGMRRQEIDLPEEILAWWTTTGT